MPREAGEWNKATRTGARGVHVYIPSEQLERALKHAQIDPKEADLEAKITGVNTNWRGRGRVIIELRKRKPKEIAGAPAAPLPSSEDGRTHPLYPGVVLEPWTGDDDPAANQAKDCILQGKPCPDGLQEGERCGDCQIALDSMKGASS